MLDLNGKTHEVPSWIIRKNLSQPKASAWDRSCERVVRETEKAVLVVSTTDYGWIDLWVPKSVLVSHEELEKQEAAEVAHRQNNWKYTNYLKQLAADNNVKIGNMSSWEKIIAKLQSKGVEVKTREEFAA